MKKNKLNLNYNQIRNLLDKYGLYTLDSFEILLRFVKNYDLLDTNLAFINIYNKKYQENINNFNGRNDYDYITRIMNFDIAEIINSVDKLSQEELTYLNNLVEDAKKNIKPDSLEANILPNLSEFVYSQESKKLKSKLPTIEDLSSEDIEKLFNKYNVVELEAFISILEYVKDYNTDEIANIISKVYKEKYELLQSNFEVGAKPTNFKISDLGKINELLNDYELEFLHTMIESASMFLDSVQEFEDEYKEISEEFDSGDYPVLEMSKLLDSIEQEQTSRKNYPIRNQKKKTI